MIRPATPEDAAQISAIYNHYISETTITFEEQHTDAVEIAKRIEETIQNLPWIVFEENSSIKGYAYASKWKGRCSYRYSVETTVYLDPDEKGRGLGTLLYKDLISHLQEQGYRTAIGGIALPNSASIALHEKLGFQKVAHFKEVGMKFGNWIDVGYWQLML